MTCHIGWYQMALIPSFIKVFLRSFTFLKSWPQAKYKVTFDSVSNTVLMLFHVVAFCFGPPKKKPNRIQFIIFH